MIEMFVEVAYIVQVLPMVGELKNLRLATHVLYFIQRLIIYSNIQAAVASARTKADSKLLPISPTSSPTIGNTLVACSLVTR
jgi:hypothetical protein